MSRPRGVVAGPFVVPAPAAAVRQLRPTPLSAGLHAGVLLNALFLLAAAVIVWLFLGRGRDASEGGVR